MPHIIDTPFKRWKNYRLYISVLLELCSKETEVQTSSLICPKIIKQAMASKHDQTPEAKKKMPHLWKNPYLRIVSHVFSFISRYCIHYSQLDTGDLQDLKMHHVPGGNQRTGLHYALFKSYLHDHRLFLIYKSTVFCNVTWKNRRGTLLHLQCSTEHGVGFPG